MTGIDIAQPPSLLTVQTRTLNLTVLPSRKVGTDVAVTLKDGGVTSCSPFRRPCHGNGHAARIPCGRRAVFRHRNWSPGGTQAIDILFVQQASFVCTLCLGASLNRSLALRPADLPAAPADRPVPVSCSRLTTDFNVRARWSGIAHSMSTLPDSREAWESR